ncbi:MAG TPA: hypothetical protein PKY31_02050 [Spirochaetota bacterium]|nr:hypothetical protein [Spirochaetota bacterium]
MPEDAFFKEGDMEETTVNIGRDEYEALSRAAEDTGATLSAMISAMLKYMALRTAKREAVWGRVKYQERREAGEWRMLHLWVGRDEYDFFMDLKKVGKMSVSFLIAEAIRLYLDEFLIKLKGDVDSYRYHNYAISKIYVGDVTCWVFYWGIPTTLLTAPPT